MVMRPVRISVSSDALRQSVVILLVQVLCLLQSTVLVLLLGHGLSARLPGAHGEDSQKERSVESVVACAARGGGMEERVMEHEDDARPRDLYWLEETNQDNFSVLGPEQTNTQ